MDHSDYRCSYSNSRDRCESAGSRTYRGCDRKRGMYPQRYEFGHFDNNVSLNTMLSNLGYDRAQIETIFNMRKDSSFTLPDGPALSTLCFDYVKIQNHKRNWKKLPTNIGNYINNLIHNINLPRANNKLEYELSKVASCFADQICEIVQSHLSQSTEDVLLDLSKCDLTELPVTQCLVSNKFRGRFHSDFLEECWSDISERTHSYTDKPLVSHVGSFADTFSTIPADNDSLYDGFESPEHPGKQISYDIAPITATKHGQHMHKQATQGQNNAPNLPVQQGENQGVTTVPFTPLFIVDRDTLGIPPAPPIEGLRIREAPRRKAISNTIYVHEPKLVFEPGAANVLDSEGITFIYHTNVDAYSLA